MSALVEFDFEGEEKNDLPLKVGDVVTVQGDAGDGWLVGECNGKRGSFPAAYVKMIDLQDEPATGEEGHDCPADTPNLPEPPFAGPCLLAEFDFQSTSDLELSLSDGEFIRFIRRIDSEWLEGERADGSQRGLLPAAYVVVLCDIPAETTSFTPAALSLSSTPKEIKEEASAPSEAAAPKPAAKPKPALTASVTPSPRPQPAPKRTNTKTILQVEKNPTGTEVATGTAEEAPIHSTPTPKPRVSPAPAPAPAPAPTTTTPTTTTSSITARPASVAVVAQSIGPKPGTAPPVASKRSLRPKPVPKSKPVVAKKPPTPAPAPKPAIREKPKITSVAVEDAATTAPPPTAAASEPSTAADLSTHTSTAQTSIVSASTTPATVFSVTALFDYDSEEPSDLTLRQGDIVDVLQVCEGGLWYDGCVRGHADIRGLFPVTFASAPISEEEVDDIDDDDDDDAKAVVGDDVAVTVVCVSSPEMKRKAATAASTRVKATATAAEPPVVSKKSQAPLPQPKPSAPSSFSTPPSSMPSSASASPRPMPRPKPKQRSDATTTAATAVPSAVNEDEQQSQQHSTSSMPVVPPSVLERVSEEDTHEAADGLMYVAVATFVAEDDDEISFTTGERVRVVEVVDADWMRGSRADDSTCRLGLFPSSFVTIETTVTSSPALAHRNNSTDQKKSKMPRTASASSASSVGMVTGNDADDLTKAVVVFPFVAENPGELTLVDGEKIHITQQLDEEWYEARTADGTLGVVPIAFVEVLENASTPTAASSVEDIAAQAAASVGATTGSKPHASSFSSVSSSTTPSATPPSSRHATPTPHARPRTMTPQSSLSTASSPLFTKPLTSVASNSSASSSSAPSRRISFPKRKSSTRPTISIVSAAPMADSPTPDSPSSTTSSTSSMPTMTAQEKQQKQRANVVKELITTEGAFVDDLVLIKEGYVDRLRADNVRGIDIRVIFANVEDVLITSQKLYAALLPALDLPPYEQQIGECFISLGEEIKTAFAIYGSHNDDANEAVMVIMKAGGAPAQYLTERHQEIRAQTNVWDLNTLLIRPVQRLLKYPLLLAELLKATPEDHPDRNNIVAALDVIKEAAQEMNESKRRKELVTKYTGKEQSNSSLSWRSVRKKGGRLVQSTLSKIGAADRTVDRHFEEEEQRFRALDKALRALGKNVDAHLEGIKEELSAQVELAQAICDLYSDLPGDAGQALKAAVNGIQRNVLRDYESFLASRVTRPLESLLAMFKNPMVLIDKRNKKLLDYDNFKNSGRDDEETTLAKNVYNALNDKLLAELPSFRARCCRLLVAVVASLLHAFRQLQSGIVNELKMVSAALAPAASGSSSASLLAAVPTEETMEVFRRHIAYAVSQITGMTIIPAYFSKVFESQIGKNTLATSSFSASPAAVSAAGRRSGANRSAPARPGPTRPTASAPSQNLVLVEFDYDAEADTELTVHAGDSCVLQRKCDDMGNAEWWLVELNGQSGYVPADFFAQS